MGRFAACSGAGGGPLSLLQPQQLLRRVAGLRRDTWVTLALAGWLGSALGLSSSLNLTSVEAHSMGPDCAPKQPAPRTRMLAGGLSVSSPFTATALLPGPLVKGSSGVTACGGLSLISDHCSSPLPPGSRASPDAQGLRAPLPALPSLLLCVPPIWSSGSVRSKYWLNLATPGTSPWQWVLNVVWVAQEGAGDEERPPCPVLGKQPPTGLPGRVFGCLNCTQWACGSERKIQHRSSSRACIHSCSFCL